MNLQKINKIKNKQSIFFATSLVLVMTLSMLAALPSVAASDPPITIPTYAYVVVTPDPVGVNQAVFIVMWLDKAPQLLLVLAVIDGKTLRLKSLSLMVLLKFLDHLHLTLHPQHSQHIRLQLLGIQIDFSFPGQKLSLYNPTNGVAGTNSPFINDTFATSLHQQLSQYNKTKLRTQKILVFLKAFGHDQLKDKTMLGLQ